ncbi:hypothetical protein LXN10_12375 [Arcobacter sp. KX21116]|uniref:hypothetical protein n=1 Tax=Arcobacter iocasae TaxID=2906515 RepID=UPI0035D412D2
MNNNNNNNNNNNSIDKIIKTIGYAVFIGLGVGFIVFAYLQKIELMWTASFANLIILIGIFIFSAAFIPYLLRK